MLLTAVLIAAIFMNLNLASGEVDEEEINEENGIAKNPHVYGDLILTPYQEKIMIGGGNGRAQGFLHAATPWPNGVLPFQLDRRLNSKAKQAITAAMEEFEEKTCIRFVQRKNNNQREYPNYVYFTPKRGCFSYYGVVGGRQPISIGRGCEIKGIVQHEILHALGRIHEHTRTDRDDYVKINEENIKKGYEHNFKIMKADQQGFPYDYGSIMHYGKYAFTSNGKPTVVPHRQVTIGQRKKLSDVDWAHLKKAYCSLDEKFKSSIKSSMSP